MSTLKKLLRDVGTGKTEFRPASGSSEDLEAFQSTVALLRDADQRGLIHEPLFETSKKRDSYGLGLFVQVNGLTPDGTRFVQGTRRLLTWKRILWFVGSGFTVVTTLSWFWLSIGSWVDLTSDVPGIGNGCAEFELTAPLSGQIDGPGGAPVVTQYSGGYFLLNRGTFNFETYENGELGPGGVAVVWLNPFTTSIGLTYKIQSRGGTPIAGGYRQDVPLRFDWQTGRCPDT